MVDVNGAISAESPLPERTVMRYASTYDKTGAPVVAEVQGDLLVPLVGLTELGPATTAEALLGAERLTADAFPAVGAELRPVVPNPAKVFCVGLNYKAHIEETGRSDSDYPVLFPKFASSLAGPFAELELPAESHQIDYEASSPSSSAGPAAGSARRTRPATSSATRSPTTSRCATSSTRPTSGCRARRGTA